MACAGDTPSIFKSLSCESGSTEAPSLVCNIDSDLSESDIKALLYLTEVCFEEEELQRKGGIDLTNRFCDILHKIKLPSSFIAKLLHEIGRKDLVKKYFLNSDVCAKSLGECSQLINEQLSDENTLLNDERLDRVVLLFR